MQEKVVVGVQEGPTAVQQGLAGEGAEGKQGNLDGKALIVAKIHEIAEIEHV